MKHSTVLIVPEAMRDAANQLAEVMGWGSDSYEVLLQDAEGNRFYGLHAWTSEKFKRWLTGEQPLPSQARAAKPILEALIYSFKRNIQPGRHFQKVLSNHGLDMVEEND